MIEQNNKLFSVIYENLINSKNEYDFEIDKLLELACQFAQTDIDKQKIKNYLKNLIDASAYLDNYLKIYNKFFVYD